jgi:hypothetical protein
LFVLETERPDCIKGTMESSMKFPPGPQGIGVSDLAKLAHSFHVTREAVLSEYDAQYRRLAESARIRQYVDLLAFKNTRLALHDAAAPHRTPPRPE